jgi:hypothetical protein
MAHPADVDAEQLTALRQFRQEMQQRGLVGTYASLEDLAAKVRTALGRDVDELVDTGATPGDRTRRAGGSATPGAILRAKYAFDREPETDSKGRTRTRTRRERLTVENLGAVAAEHMEVSIEAASDGEPPVVHGDLTFERLPSQGFVDIPLMTFGTVADRWLVTMRWQESGQSFEERQSVTAF